MYHTRTPPFHRSPPLPSPLWLQCISKMLLCSQSARSLNPPRVPCDMSACSSSFAESLSAALPSHFLPHLTVDHILFVLHFHVSAHLREERFKKPYLFKLFHHQFTDGKTLQLKTKDINEPTQVQCQLQEEVLSSALSARLQVASTVK